MNISIMDLIHNLDSTTYNHSIRVMALAREYEDYKGIQNCRLSRAALVHDVGKVFVTGKILDKIGRLDKIEKELIDLHPYIGYQLLKDIGVEEEVCRIVLYHHGKDPITLSKLPDFCDADVDEYALMLHTLDAFEALTSDRPYHVGMPGSQALTILLEEKNFHFSVMNFLTRQLSEGRHSAVDRQYYVRDMVQVADTLRYLHVAA